jgi:hypothetical protein
MVRRRFGIPMAFALISILSLPSAEVRGEDPKDPAPSPMGISVRSKDGSDSLKGFCHEEGQHSVCDVTEVRIHPPDLKHLDEEVRNTLQEFKEGPEAKKHLRDIAGNLKEDAAKVRADSTSGPKLRRISEDTLAAAQAQDVERWAHAVWELDRRTCHIRMSRYQLKFHRVGPRKWVTDAEPEGECRIVNVWEMTADDEQAMLLTLVHTVAVGNPGAGVKGMCQSISEAEASSSPLSSSGNRQFEPQPSCDFISLF